MRVLVTGHLGYVGSLLGAALRARGHEVVGLDCALYRDPRDPRGGPAPAPGDRLADVRDVGPDDLAGFDAVAHLAGLCNDPLGALDPGLTDQVNHRAAAAVARAARAAGAARFVLASSCSVYGGCGETWVDEDTGPRPLTAYAASKARAEEAVLALAGAGFSPVALRCATAYGASPALRGDLVLNNLVGHAVATGEVVLNSDGRAWRPLVHVRDVAAAFVAAIEAPATAVRATVLNVGTTPDNHRIADLAERVARACGARLRARPGAGRDARSYRVRCERIRAALPAFRPEWTVEAGIAELRGACRRERIGPADCDGGRFDRLAVLRARRARGEIDAELRAPPRAAAGAGAAG